MKIVLFFLFILLTYHIGKAQPQVTFLPVVSGLSSPVDVAEVNDGTNRLFIVEKTGTIRIWNGTSLSSTPFLNVSTIIASGGEQGLLSLAFHPDYATNGFFFIYYTAPSRDITIARYSRSTNDAANPASGVVLMSIPKLYSNHNGGKLLFGTDGYLYFGTGDGGSGGDPQNNAQNNNSLLGKMLRIDVNHTVPPYYTIPPTNPFFGSTSARNEIIANGLRNPWRWSFDKQTGDMWIADVGQNQWEEVNYIPASETLNKNYGWKCFEGSQVYSTSCTAQPNNVFPLFEYPHNNSTGGYSITGGYVYRGAEYPALQGYYLFADYVSGNGWLTSPNGSGGWNTTRQSNWVNGISSFGERSDGTLYAVTLSGGLYKVAGGSSVPVKLVSFTGSISGNNYTLTWNVQNEETGDEYIIEKRTDNSETFTEVKRLKASANNANNNYKLSLPAAPGLAFFRLKIVAKDGQVHYSPVINLKVFNKNTLKASISGSNIIISFPAGTKHLQLSDAVGRVLKNTIVEESANQFLYPLKDNYKGILLVRALVNNEWQTVRVLR